ncbi:hypothetical protein ACP70R_012561 [Stipagrostis hirtigluma subsp. patula]
MGEMAAQTMQCRVSNGGEEGGGGGMRTVECLRGRLLAERVASKAAKEEADQLARRLDELEKKLAGEVKVRDKAERRLRKVIKKLEALKILDVEILSDGSVGSLSSNGRSGHQALDVEERNNPGSLTSGDSAPSGPPGDSDGDSAGGSSAGSCTQVNNSQDGSWCSVVSDKQSRPSHCMDLGGPNNNNCNSEEHAGYHDSDRQHNAAASDGSAKSDGSFRDEGHDDRLALVLVDPELIAEADDSRTQDDTQAAEFRHSTQVEEQEGEEENKLAIVLVDPQPQPDAAAKDSVKPHGDVESVLLALRRVKEQLRYTIERRSELVAHRELYGH